MNGSVRGSFTNGGQGDWPQFTVTATDGPLPIRNVSFNVHAPQGFPVRHALTGHCPWGGPANFGTRAAACATIGDEREHSPDGENLR